MRPTQFSYHRAHSAAEAIEYLARYGEEARPLAGGQSLIPLMNFRVVRPAALVDLARCSDLVHIRVEDEALVIGAMTRQRDAEMDPLLQVECPLVARVLRFAGPPTIRNRATVGGSIAHADPVAELPAVALALGAKMTLRGPAGERIVAAPDFFLAELTTAIMPGELLCEIRFPRRRPQSRSWFGEFGNHAGGTTLAGAVAYVEAEPDGTIGMARFALNGVATVPVRLPTLERAVIGRALDAAVVVDAVRADLADLAVLSGIHDEPEHRRQLAVALFQDAFAALAVEPFHDRAIPA